MIWHLSWFTYLFLNSIVIMSKWFIWCSKKWLYLGWLWCGQATFLVFLIQCTLSSSSHTHWRLQMRKVIPEPYSSTAGRALVLHGSLPQPWGSPRHLPAPSLPSRLHSPTPASFQSELPPALAPPCCPRAGAQDCGSSKPRRMRLQCQNSLKSQLCVFCH